MRVKSWQNMLPNMNISRSLIANKLEIIVKNNPTHNRLQGIGCEESTGASLTPESEMHVCRTDSHKTGRRSDSLLCIFLLLLATWSGSRCSQLGRQCIPVFGLSTPPESVEGFCIWEEVHISA